MSEALSDREVQELVRIADARIKEWKNHWYTLGIPIPHRYGLDDQLEAIRQLGGSRSPMALEYLKKINEFKDWSESGDPSQGDADFGGRCYVNARGELASRLGHSWANLEARGASNSEADEECLSILGIAIFRLKESLR